MGETGSSFDDEIEVVRLFNNTQQGDANTQNPSVTENLVNQAPIQPSASSEAVSGFRPLYKEEAKEVNTEVVNHTQRSSVVENVTSQTPISEPGNVVSGFRPLNSTTEKPGAVETPNITQDSGTIQLENKTEISGEASMEQERRKGRNNDIMEKLSSEPEYERAFKKISLGDKPGLVFQRGMYEWSRRNLGSNLGIAEKYSSPTNIQDLLQEEHSAYIFTEDGLTVLITGGVRNRGEEEYNRIYERIMSGVQNESQGDTIYQTSFTDQDMGLYLNPQNGVDPWFYKGVHIPSGLFDENLKNFLPTLHEKLKMASEYEKQYASKDPNSADYILNAMKGGNS